MTAQHLTRLESRRRLATLVAFAIEMEVALTDAAILMVEKPVGAMFRRADRTRSAVLWLCSPGAGFVIGHALAVDGGYVAR